MVATPMRSGNRLCARKSWKALGLDDYRQHLIDQGINSNRSLQCFSAEFGGTLKGTRPLLEDNVPSGTGMDTVAAPERLKSTEEAFRDLLGALPAAIYVTDAAGRITYYNDAAVALWGLSPVLGNSKFCGSWRLYRPDGTPLPHDQCPMAMALEQRKPIRGAEAIAERPDGVRVPFISYPTPFFDASGTLTGGVNMLVDISKHKQAVEALGERNTQLALAGKIALVGSFAFDIVSGRMQVSEGYAAIHGLADGTAVTKRADWRTRVHPDDLQRMEDHLQQAFAERRREHYCEYRIVRSGGEIRWIESRSSISYGRDGAPQRIVGANIDVTERKQTEGVLKESEVRLANVLAAGQVMAFEWDASTGQSRRSDNAAHILGIQQSMARSRHNDFLKRVHPDDRERFKTHVRELSPSNPSYALNFRFCCPDGRQVWLEETAKGAFDSAGRLLRIEGLTRDITERKTAELALVERTLQLALAERAALVGSVTYDPETGKMEISDGYAAIHGFPVGTTEIARSEWELGVHPEDRVRLEELRSQAFRKRSNEYSVDYRIVRPGGEVRWIDARLFILYRSDGRPQRVVGVNIDISERKRAEEHQRALNAELDHRVKNVLATVSAIITQTPKADSSLVDFVAGLDGRIKSLARTHELLSRRHWRSVSLAEIVRRELAPYTAGNAEIGGPRVTLRAEATQAVAMVLHELATNAAKYGAFSNRNGRVLLNWRWRQNGSHGRLVIEWREIGGPRVPGPSQSGYGTAVIRELVPFELGGTVELAFASEGISCRLEIPGDWVSRGSPLSGEPQGLHSS